MSERENAQVWRVREQIVEDPASGLTLQFEVAPDGENTLRIYGDLPYGNRTLSFTADGRIDGRGTLVSGLCKPAWPERPLAPTPQPITAAWLREQGWEEKPPYGDWTLALCGASSVFLMPYANTTGHFNVYFDNSIVWSFIRRVTDTADLANLVAALRGGGK